MYSESRWRVLVLHKNSLFAEAVDGLLQGRPGLDVVTVDVGREDPRGVIAAIKPNVVILDKDDSGVDAAELVSQFLCTESPARVVYISTCSPSVEVFGKWHTKVDNVDELLDTMGQR
ncbi:MAG: hypothetical protein HY664_00450 [Chloroflexi bacterium]|nr:hypothetical protein [Chloroflexota bacterium]